MSNCNPIHALLASAATKGQHVRGGCDSCDAHQTLEEVDDGIWSLTVHHDDDCPVLRAAKAKTN